MTNPKKLTVQSGDKFGKLEILQEVERFTQPSAKTLQEASPQGTRELQGSNPEGWTRQVPCVPGQYWLKQKGSEPWITEIGIIAGSVSMEFGDGSWDTPIEGIWCPVHPHPPIPEDMK